MADIRQDGICLDDEDHFDVIYHPFRPEKNSNIANFKRVGIVMQVMKKGITSIQVRDPYKIAQYVRDGLKNLPDEHKRFEFPHIYRVGISRKLMDLRKSLIEGINSSF